ncbi:MAG: LLM class flavin-dependent oxidoreductase [Fimbriimonadales bacterium]
MEIITRMLAPGHATYQGKHAQVTGAINMPKGIQRHTPIIVGGNGPVRTAGYAVKFADELNLVFASPAQCAERMVDVRARCEKEGRDPATLRFSVYAADEEMRDGGQKRVDLLAGYAAVGMDRLVGFPTRWDTTPDTQAAFAEDCRTAGIALGAR